MKSRHSMTMWYIRILMLVLITLVSISIGQLEPKLPYMEFPGPNPGAAVGTINGDEIVLENNCIRMKWSKADDHLVPTVLEDKLKGTVITLTNANSFKIRMSGQNDAEIFADIPGSSFDITNTSPFQRFTPLDPENIQLAKRFAGTSVQLTMVSPDKDIEVEWKVILLDNTNYIRQEFSFKNLTNSSLRITRIYFLEQNGQNPKTHGTEKAGCPVSDGNFFFGVESPFGFHNFTGNKMAFWMDRPQSLGANAIYKMSSVTGVAASGQLRRSFWYYLSLQRCHYYRQYVNWNAWYDSPGNYTEAYLRGIINTLGKELHEKRGVHIKTYTVDDGWDNPNSSNTWTFSSRLPNGFKNLLSLVDKYDAGFGTWMSPFGGYGGRQQRINAARSYGAETKTWGSGTWFSIAGPNYYNRFKTAALDLLENHGLNFMKVEFVPDAAMGYIAFWQADAENVNRLADTIRGLSPEFYFNATNGTYGSPWWLMHLEAIWKGGGDAPNLRIGSNSREHWIGGRDRTTYTGIVRRSPLYPIASTMIHGITIGDALYPANYSNDIKSIKHEVRSFYASGCVASELYLTPRLLTQEMYDVIAEAQKWAYSIRDIMEDSRWIGGEPKSGGDPYGRAGWNKRGGYIYLRNPETRNKSFTFDVKDLFELPEGAETEYYLKSPWAEDADDDSVLVVAGKDHTIQLGDQEVIVLDAKPKNPVGIIPANLTQTPLKLTSIYPNPFRSSVTIDYRSNLLTKLTAEVIDVKGKTLHTLTSKKTGQNTFRITWDGKGTNSKPVAAGVYLFRLKSGNATVIKKILKQR